MYEIGKNPPKEEEPSFTYYTVTLLIKNKLRHYLVKAESALNALEYAQEECKAPAIGCHYSEYLGVLDAMPEEGKVSEAEFKEEKKELAKDNG